MINFNFEGVRVSVPTKWAEVTVEHFIKKEFLSGNAIQLLSVLSGIPAIKLANTTKDLTKHFERAVGFIKAEPLGWRKGSKEEVLLMGVECRAPVNLELETFGQKILFGQALLKSTFHYEAIPEAVAIYLAPQIYPDDWFERIDEVALEVKKLPIRNVWSMADFFLTNTLTLRRGGQII